MCLISWGRKSDRRSRVRRHSRAAIESGASQRVILFKFTRRDPQELALGSNTAAPDATMKRGNQVAIQIALYFWRNAKAG